MDQRVDQPTTSSNDPILVTGHGPNNRDAAARSRPDGLPLVVIAGPTAVGKTAAGIALARRFGGEVVNADSRNLYRGMDIGTAKPTSKERAEVPHHLIDVLDPTEEMSLARYQEMATSAIAAVQVRHRLPFLVGGTPLYVNAVVEGWRIPQVPPDPYFRAAQEARVAAGALPELLEELAQVDPVAAARCGPNARRVIRALEVFRATGRPMSELEGKGPPPYRTLEFGLKMPRALLHRAVDERVEEQVRDGLVDEVRRLLAAGVPAEAPAMSSLGYRQMVPFLAGEVTLAEAVARIKTDTHRYVRHQETWLRRNPALIALDVTETGWRERAAALVERFVGLGGPSGR
jgi:tRNA dimethylallyltransferase